jgi:hypothetical protein
MTIVSVRRTSGTALFRRELQICEQSDWTI